MAKRLGRAEARWLRSGVVTLCVVLGILSHQSGMNNALADTKSAEMITGCLKSGQLRDGEASLKAMLEKSPKDDVARTGLGLVQFVRAVEHLTQALYRYGCKPDGAGIRLPFLRLPLPVNDHPEVVRYADLRHTLQNLIDDMAIAETSLAAVQDKTVKLNLPLTRIRLDINGNGLAENDELLVKLLAAVALPGRPTGELLKDEMIVGFDYADVLWLRGYGHLLSAMAHTVLMYNEQSTFDLMAPYVFSKPELPAAQFKLQIARDSWDVDHWVDLIAAVHKAVYPVQDPERGAKVLKHLHEVIALSRLTWAEILSETDNDHEWIPNPKQTSVIPGIRITQEMVNTWHAFLSEAERLIDGDLLIPHWRLPVEAGVNLKRFFTEPQELDVIMLVHGQAVLRYAERGRCTAPETWQLFQNMFGGQFIGFAVWFN